MRKPCQTFLLHPFVSGNLAMSVVQHELLNVDQGIHDTRSRISNANNAASVSMRRLVGGLSDGVDVVTVNNGRLSLQLLPTRGMGVWQGEADGLPLRWNSPVERPVNPAFVDQMRRGGIGWLDGFNELICRCGLGWHGAPGNDTIVDESGNVVSDQFLPLHGRIANIPAHRVSAVVDADRISVTGIVDEGCLFGGRLRLEATLTTGINSTEFEITDVVTNLGSQPAEVEMLYHCNIGEPFLGEGSMCHTASSEVAPRNQHAADGLSMWNLFQGPTSGYAEQVYFTKPAPDSAGEGIAVLCDANSERAFSVRFDTSTLPWFILWKNTQATQDGYVTGLEPGSSFPNSRGVERKAGRVISLAAGESVTFRLRFEAATEKARVREILDEVTALQVATPRTVHESPKVGWVP
jgi:galactose mutarotase-like enzyme